jgi:hypothetical protein
MKLNIGSIVAVIILCLHLSLILFYHFDSNVYDDRININCDNYFKDNNYDINEDNIIDHLSLSTQIKISSEEFDSDCDNNEIIKNCLRVNNNYNCNGNNTMNKSKMKSLKLRRAITYYYDYIVSVSRKIVLSCKDTIVYMIGLQSFEYQIRRDLYYIMNEKHN